MSYLTPDLTYSDSSAYDERINHPLERYLFDLWNPILIDQIKHMKPLSTIADLGCGTFEHTRHMNQASRVYAVELNPLMIEHGRRKMKRFTAQLIVLEESALATSIPDHSCDYVWCIGLSEYVELAGLFSEISRICKDDGTVIIQFSNRYNPHNFVAWVAHALLRKPTKAYRTASQFRKTAKKYGFRVEQTESAGVFAYVPLPLQRYCIPLWKMIDRLYSPFEPYLPLGVSVLMVLKRMT